MEAEFCLPRHLRSNPFLWAHCNRPPPIFVPTRFLKTQPPIRLSTHQNNRPLIFASGFHANKRLQTFFHWRLSTQKQCFPWSCERPHNGFPASTSAGDTRGDGAGVRISATALATTAVILACIALVGGGIRLKGVEVLMGDGAAMAGVVATSFPDWLNMPVGARAVQALLDMSDYALTQDDLDIAKRKFRQHMRPKNKLNYRELQEAARVLIKSSEAEKMMEALQRKFEDFCDTDEEQDAVEMGLIIAEMQIYQGNYKEAINILHYSFYNSETMTKDVRPDLYRVAANLMSGNKKEAQGRWNELKSKEEYMYPPTTSSEAGDQQQRIPSTISEFEAAVRKRKANVLKARKSRPKPR